MKDKLLLSDKLISLMTLACVCGARNILVCWEDVSGRTHIRITPKRGRKRATDEPCSSRFSAGLPCTPGEAWITWLMVCVQLY